MHTTRLATDVINVNAKFQVSRPDSRLFASRRLVCFSAENVIQDINVDVEKCDHQKPALIFVEVADCRMSVDGGLARYWMSAFVQETVLPSMRRRCGRNCFG